jgi:methyl-accepting chemotaxis protein
MKKIIYSLQTKLIASFVLLIIVIAGGTFFYTFNETKIALKDTMRDELKAVASVVATQINGDSLAVLKKGDETKAAFLSIRDQLLTIRKSHPDIKFVYTMKKDGGKVYFSVDADYGNTDDAANIGDEYPETNPRMMEGFSKVSVDDDFTIDEWGSVLTGYAPIKDSKGNFVGLVGIDMDSERVIQKQNFIGDTIYLIIGIGILVAAVIIGIFSLTIIRDIKKLNYSATEISKGNSDVFIDIKRKDEIGELANSFSRMIASLKFMMLDQQENK